MVIYNIIHIPPILQKMTSAWHGHVSPSMLQPLVKIPGGSWWMIEDKWDVHWSLPVGGFNVCLWSSLLFGMVIQNDQAPLSLYLPKIHRFQISSIYRCKPSTRLQYIRIQPYFSVEGSTDVIVRYGGNFTTFGYWVGGRRRTDSLSWEYMGVSCLDVHLSFLPGYNKPSAWGRRQLFSWVSNNLPIEMYPQVWITPQIIHNSTMP